MTAGRKTADIPDGLGAGGRSGERNDQAPSALVLARDLFKHLVIEIVRSACGHLREIAQGAIEDVGDCLIGSRSDECKGRDQRAHVHAGYGGKSRAPAGFAPPDEQASGVGRLQRAARHQEHITLVAGAACQLRAFPGPRICGDRHGFFDRLRHRRAPASSPAVSERPRFRRSLAALRLREGIVDGREYEHCEQGQARTKPWI
ncbi:MAG: hypothetical protein F9K29_16070 [Hyphomicrobiaceae bacterium]|nr:MAG: hypothetical protein F9K29_16070 [Hyphomicrobiaceae bacterium]